MRDQLADHGLADAIVPQKTRVSLKVGKERYLKYDYAQKRWVFCLAIGDRMDQIDPDQICTRTNQGTRLENAVAVYDKTILEPLFPILDRVVELFFLDVRRQL